MVGRGSIKSVESFKFKDHKSDIGFEWKYIFTRPVEVTSGRPSYNKEKGLKINVDYNSREGHPTFDKVSGSVLEVGQDDARDLVVSFMRTIRVPESDKDLPSSMAAKGGFFFPMYRESSQGGMASIIRGMNPETRNQDYIVLPEQLWLDGIATAPRVVNQFVATKMAPPQRERSRKSQKDGSSKKRDASSDPSTHDDTPKGASIEWQVAGRDEVGGLQL
ncbi:putative integral membrane protein [Fusarium austroafricanum]|uniref:Putative integral membrane protein n=1 Tax=Fusarium austroafricanum TaxID=2364996 RepID=A0A8H4P2V9_9HYPO|nr:putative integral membrane protein [Fusarium austroafricanum]